MNNGLIVLGTTFVVLTWLALIVGVGNVLLDLWEKCTRRYAARPVMTENEREFFGRLTAAHRGGYVFPQVSMGALLEPRAKGRAGLGTFRRISQKRVDYAVHDGDLSLICVVELDDRTHDARKDIERDQLLRSAGIQTLRWDSRPRPSVAEIRIRLLQLQQEQRQQQGAKA